MRRIRCIHPQAVVILLTAYGSSEDREAAQVLGVFDVVTKRVGLEDLDLAVARALGTWAQVPKSLSATVFGCAV